jgi:hypothetical protein
MMRYKKRFRGASKPAKVFFFLTMAVLFAVILGTVVMWLWNAIIPEVTGFKPLNWWQAIGLLVLSRILFGGMRFGSGNSPWARKRKYWKERWQHMSPEERVRMREKWQQRRGCTPKKEDNDADSEGKEINVQ